MSNLCIKRLCGKRLRYPLVFLVIMLITLYISTYWYQLVLIRGDSMLPAYHNMQLVLMDRHSQDYTYGDVVVFRCSGLDTVLIKRIAACPGDEVFIRESRLCVNGDASTVFPQEYLFEYAGIAENPLQLTANQYFVIGDNIEKSKDSRYLKVGCVSADSIKGKLLKSFDNRRWWYAGGYSGSRNGEAVERPDSEQYEMHD